MSSEPKLALKTDALLVQIADYVFDTVISSEEAFKTAYCALLDSIACAMMALDVPQCRQLLGPIVPGSIVPKGARVLGTSFELDPIKAAFDIGSCIRWLDYNDTWLAKEWGHPSDNLGGILSVGDYVCRQNDKNLSVHRIIESMIKAYEIQGVLALGNAFNEVGLDHVILVKVATAAVISQLYGLSKSQTIDVLSNAFIDGHSLRTYRHAPNTGPRKSWAAGDATSRAVFLTWMIKQGQTGYPQALTAKRWGFSDVLLQGKSITLERPFGSYVMENILFKVAFPAEFHAQTAVECAFQLHPQVIDRLQEIDRIKINTQISAIRIIDKTGPLHNYADRDHCLQYMVAIGLLFGTVTAQHYSDEIAKDPRIDFLRDKMQVNENPRFSRDYLNPDVRSIANELQIFFKDGTSVGPVIVEYPLGHKRRRGEALPYLQQKFESAIAGCFEGDRQEKLLNFWQKPERVTALSISDFITAFVK